MSYADYKTLLFTRAGAVLTVTINRPQSLNAVNDVLHRELSTVFGEIAADTTVDAVVLTGAGKAFSAGGDLDFFRTVTPAQLDAVFTEARKIIVDLVDLPQPIISAINGAAAGLGATNGSLLRYGRPLDEGLGQQDAAPVGEPDPRHLAGLREGVLLHQLPPRGARGVRAEARGGRRTMSVSTTTPGKTEKALGHALRRPRSSP
jgi:hypothetical protein